MDKNNILLLVFLLISEIMGAIPEKYLWVNGYLDAVCKVINEVIKQKKETATATATASITESTSAPSSNDIPL
uniref:Uncharacterized protein n=1 Tax=viral metagenome TaxID=1070528 RepID=A0A6C0K5A4_9ZZZZ